MAKEENKSDLVNKTATQQNKENPKIENAEKKKAGLIAGKKSIVPKLSS